MPDSRTDCEYVEEVQIEAEMDRAGRPLTIAFKAGDHPGSCCYNFYSGASAAMCKYMWNVQKLCVPKS